MFTSGNKTVWSRLEFLLGWTLFLVLFGAIYEHFSHGVYSYFMIYAFAPPLLLGVAPLMFALGRGLAPREEVLGVWSAALVTLSVGSVLRGVVEIYGTTSRLLIVYPVAAALLAFLTLLLHLKGRSTLRALPEGRRV